MKDRQAGAQEIKAREFGVGMAKAGVQAYESWLDEFGPDSGERAELVASIWSNMELVRRCALSETSEGRR